jgi:predicted nucleotidyltransferase
MNLLKLLDDICAPFVLNERGQQERREEIRRDEDAKERRLAMIHRAAKCEHEWKDIRNQVIESGEACFKCGELRAAPMSESKGGQDGAV